MLKANPFAEKLYADAGTDLDPVPCSEYTTEIQLQLLRIDIDTLMEPILDIGCGKQVNLVRHLSTRGKDAIGIDRFAFSDSRVITSDWLEFTYGTGKWGTVLSHLGFSNHFKHHNLREDGNYIGYAKKYMEILRSLKIGGKFHYAPDLPFIECYLNKDHYQAKGFQIGDHGFETTVITRLK